MLIIKYEAPFFVLLCIGFNVHNHCLRKQINAILFAVVGHNFISPVSCIGFGGIHKCSHDTDENPAYIHGSNIARTED